MGWAFLNEVKYIKQSEDERSSQIIDIFIDNPNPTEHESRFSPQETFGRRVSLASSSLKHEAFAEEREWRIAIFDVPDDSVKFRARKSMVVPYLLFELGRDDPVRPLIPRVVVGPSPYQAGTIPAIKKMMGQQVAVEGSLIPYRGW